MSQLITVKKIQIEFDKNTIITNLDSFIKNKRKGYICTINANLLSEAHINPSYNKILENAILNICDGSLLSKSLSLIHRKKLYSFPGPDFMLKIIHSSNYNNYFLGSDDITLSNLKVNLSKLNPNISHSTFQSLPFEELDNFNFPKIASVINVAKPDIIWVSLGAPKQEAFASRLIDFLEHGIIICVGAAFTFYSKTKGTRRAPIFLRKLNLEWGWRLFQDPIKTYIRLKREIILIPRILLQERKRLNNKHV